MIITNYAIQFRNAAFVFMVALTVIGVGAYRGLPREGSPDITIPYVYVTAVYEGTAPEETEKLITIPLEEQLGDVDDLKEMRSTSAEGVSSIAIEFNSGSDMDLALQRVKDKVDLARPDLPADLDEPIVQAINFSTDVPIFTFALSGRGGIERLKHLAEDLQDRIELIPGVKQADIFGTREREIRVELDPARLALFGVTVDQIMQRLRMENATISAGNIETAGNKFQVRIPGEFALPVEIPDIPLVERAGGAVYLRDVATVQDTYKDVTTISRLNGQPCVSVDVRKRNRENTVALVQRVQEQLAAYLLPPDVTLTVVYDEATYVRQSVEDLENNISAGFLLVLAVLLIFMGWRNAFFVALAIPFSMLLSFVYLRVTGLTLNMIVLFSLVLALGMLVDNAIVIVENIFRLRTLGLSRRDAARQGAAEVAWPVTTSTLTTVVAFAPLMYWPDIMGQFMWFLPVTVIVVLTASLIVALVFNPALASAFISRGSRVQAGETPSPHRFMQAYESTLRGALQHRGKVVLVGVLFLVASTLVYARFGHGFELFPEVQPRNCRIQVSFPQGTSIERTDALLRTIEARLNSYPDIRFFLGVAGQGGSMNFSPTAGSTHQGYIHVEFLEFGRRKGDTTELVNRLREDIGSVPGAEIRVAAEENGPPTGDPVSLELAGADFDTLGVLAGDIQRAIREVPGLVDVTDDLEDALPELQFHVDRNRASLLGLDTRTIGNFLRTAIYGMESSRYRADEEEYDITLRLPRASRRAVTLLDEVFVPTSAGHAVPLSSLGTLEYRPGRGSISRKDQKRVVTITGNNQERGVDKIIADVRTIIGRMPIPEGYSISYAGDTEEMQKSGAFLMQAFWIACGLILVILVIQFNSVLLPMIIMFSVVMSLVGVMWGLVLTGTRFGVVMTGLGVISLAGVVVNNAIVLIDCVLLLRSQGMDPLESVVVAGRQRLRPVLLTAVTTVLGLIPMVIGYSLEVHTWPPRIIRSAESSQWWSPMAIAVCFGLTLATVLTLVLVPVLISLTDSLRLWAGRRLAIKDD